MKDLVDFARNQPLAFVGFVMILLSTGVGSGYITTAASQEDVVNLANNYTDEQIIIVRKDMSKGFESVNCKLVLMQKKNHQSELYGLEEREGKEPNADRRR